MTALQKTKNAAKKATDNYYKPTPKKWRKIGDSFQDLSFIIGGLVIFTSSPIIGFAAMAVGRIGKILTNFASE